MRMLIDN